MAAAVVSAINGALHIFTSKGPHIEQCPGAEIATMHAKLTIRAVVVRLMLLLSSSTPTVATRPALA